MKNASIVFIATPSIVFEQIIKRISKLLEDDSYVISCTKGIKGNPFRTLSDIIKSNIDNTIGVLSGPNLAKEIAENKVTGSVIASSDSNLVDFVKTILSSDTFKIYSSNDIQGIELAGALKNIYAIICGLADAIEVGENAIGLILTRSMAEMSRFAEAKGANPITFLGLAGMGDLVATCTSKLSRNYRLGYNLGKGMNLKEAKEEIGQVAEGIRTLQVIRNESLELDIKMPLVESLYNIMYSGSLPDALISDLVNNPYEVDVEFKY
jgi:glycerol-3-phosphate dehydrogenase (NAD(P)+)